MKLTIDIKGGNEIIFDFKNLFMFKKGLKDCRLNKRANEYLFMKTERYNSDWVAGWLYGKFIFSYHCPMFVQIKD
jgi:hypothetical protein